MSSPDEAPTDPGNDPSEDREVSLLGEVLSLAPRLASRTITQIQASQHLATMLRCARTANPEGRAELGPTDDQLLAEPVDVLAVLEDGASLDNDPQLDDHSDEKSALSSEALEAGSGEGAAPPPDRPSSVPPADDLAIPGYDSLAASQVVPRLTTLGIEELAAIGAYETANRGRRTILNRVRQLQIASNGDA